MKHGFTSIEVLVVIAIVFIFSSIIFTAVRESSGSIHQVPDKPMNWSETTHNGHRYLIFVGTGIVHDPDCSCKSSVEGEISDGTRFVN